MKCVSAHNPGSTSTLKPIVFNNIPYTTNVTYITASVDARSDSRTFVVGNYYDFKNLNSANGSTYIFFVDNNGNVTSFGGSTGWTSWTISGTTLSSAGSGRYSNVGLFVLER